MQEFEDGFMKKNHIIMLYSLLAFICFCGFFYWLGTYPLLDVDETRYVDMAREMYNTKDFLTLYLNGDYFFEKPPLYFWIECFSFKLIGVVSELTARLPIVLFSLLPAGLLLFLCRKVKGDKFAIITTATLFTSLEYMFLTKIAILDSVLTSFAASSVFAYFCTFYAEEKNKKYFWILTYIFSGLAVLAKGIPGVAIPAIIIALSSIVFKTYKETLKYSWGIIIFLLITLPWHIIMLKLHGNLFFEEYIVKHHILRFIGSDVIHRTEPWYFYILTLLWGLFPHIFILLSKITKIKNIEFKDKFLTLNFIAAISILVFFSLSGAKLITYILPIYPFVAVLIGDMWMKYINTNDKAIHNSLILLNSVLTIATIGLLFAKFFVPYGIYLEFQKVQIVSLIIMIPFVISNWAFLIKKQRLQTFLSLTIFMAVLSGFLTPYIYEFNYTFGQNDLMKYAKFAKDNNYTISTYLTGKKYSLLYYGYKYEIDFQIDEDLSWLKSELKKENHIVIAKNKEIINLPVKIKEKGVKYSIIEGIKDEK